MASDVNQKPDFKIQLNIPLILLGVLLLPVLLGLGFWQLDRAEEKSLIRDQFLQKKMSDPIAIESVDLSSDPNSYRYTNVFVKGYFNYEKYWLLDNQLFQGRLGYHLLAPLEFNNQWLLVNLGWIEAPPLREYLPRISLPEHQVKIVGHLNVENPLPFVQGVSEGSNWPRRIPTLDLEKLSEEFGHKFLPITLRIDPRDSMALTAYWPVINMGPEKHKGYAAQWFSMALTLLVLLVFANTNLWQRINYKNNNEL